MNVFIIDATAQTWAIQNGFNFFCRNLHNDQFLNNQWFFWGPNGGPFAQVFYSVKVFFMIIFITD
jgi:hypothetical protein